MFCSQCGAKVDDIAKFCPACGSVMLEAVSDSETPAQQFRQPLKATAAHAPGAGKILSIAMAVTAIAVCVRYLLPSYSQPLVFL